MTNKYERFKRPYSKDWCQGFCRGCGIACADHSEDSYEWQQKLTDALKENFALKGAIRDLQDAVYSEAEKTTISCHSGAKTNCIDCGKETVPGTGSARCPGCWDDRCGHE